jgi:enoyl-CoA hydratase/carnithine racemase
MSARDDCAKVEVTRGELPHVATISFRRGEHNFFNFELLMMIVSTLEELAGTDTRAVILRSAGRHFCAGASFGPSNLAEGPSEHIHESVVPRLFAQPLPLIAVIDGAAIGGGLGLALSADFRVATPRARFAANFSRIGVSQGFGMSVTLPRVVGDQHAAELLLTGRRFGGTEAFEMGLCDRLVEPEDALRHAHDLAEQIATAAPLAVASIRRRLRAPMLSALADALTEERADQRVLRRTADFREGVAAYGARRPAKFTAS